MIRKTTLLIAVLLLSHLVFAQQKNEPATTVFFVRHAERAEEPRQDPPLTEKGVARSQELARLLSTSALKAIYTSQFTRSKQTAEPLAKLLGITSTPLALKTSAANPRMIAEESTKETVDKILSHGGGSVLVIGHSNSIPDVIKMLGGDVTPVIDEKKYDDLFVVTIYGKGKAKVAYLKYGSE